MPHSFLQVAGTIGYKYTYLAVTGKILLTLPVCALM